MIRRFCQQAKLEAALSTAEPSEREVKHFLRAEGQHSGIDGLAKDILQLRRRLQITEASAEEKDLEIKALHIALRCIFYESSSASLC